VALNVLLVLVIFAVVGLGLIAANTKINHHGMLIATLPMVVSLIYVASKLGKVLDGLGQTQSVSWVPQLGLSFDLALDGLSATMTIIIAGIGLAVMLYGYRYFDSNGQDIGRLAGLFTLFGGAMVGVVQADHLLFLYMCWELTSVTSYLLIGNKHSDPEARTAALYAILITGAGGLAMLGGFVLLGQSAGTYRISELMATSVPLSTTTSVAALLILLGAFTKSAQYPFHSWLPGAMAAPTPVSAYLHSATMVKAGVYLVARLAPILVVVGLWRPLIVAVGLTTMILGGLRALRQHDLKQLLAFSTVSQLGFMMALFGAGIPEAHLAGWLLLGSHALFKATLFMVVGILDHQLGTRDLRELPALGPRWRVLSVVTAISAASMAGLPLVFGFIAKETAFTAIADSGLAYQGLVLVGLVAGSMLTLAYAVRFWWGTFVAPHRSNTDSYNQAIPASLLGPPLVLSTLTLIFGLVPGVLNRLGQVAVPGWWPELEPVKLAIWHGWNLPVALTLITFLGGVLLFVFDAQVQPVLRLGHAIPTGRSVYAKALNGLLNGSKQLTRIVQSGSLPVYAGVILTTVAIAPAVVLLNGLFDISLPPWFHWAEVPIAAALVVAALGALLVPHRFSAALFLGTAGYSMAALFVYYGAPDLALTQVTIETLSTLAFVLVLRRLPARFERELTNRHRVTRATIAGIVGITVFAFALVAADGSLGSSVSDDIVARSLPDGHGRNIVNVILVDFRGLDTMGETTVLVAASIGAVAIARAGRRPRQAVDNTRSGAMTRIVFVDVSVRLVIHAVILTSLWLLFSGHNQPGGGFVGGLLAGSAITIRYVAGGMHEVRSYNKFKPWSVLGLGLLLAGVTTVAPLLWGKPVLYVSQFSQHLPIVGTMHLSTALAFDVGVYLTVIGMVLMVFEAFGEDPDNDPALEELEVSV